MSAFCRSESGRPGRLAPLSPRESIKCDRPRELAAIMFTLTSPPPRCLGLASESSAHLLTHLIFRLSIKSASPSRPSLLASNSFFLLSDVFQAPNHPQADTLSHLHVLS